MTGSDAVPAGEGARTDPGLVGSWRVITVERTTESGEVVEPFGSDPDGILIYGADGMTTAVVGASGRPSLDLDLIEARVTAPDADLAEAFRTASGFAVSYEIDGDVVVHRILVSTVPNWVGTEQVRPFAIDGELLTLRPPGWRLVARRLETGA